MIFDAIIFHKPRPVLILSPEAECAAIWSTPEDLVVDA
jgi:hypothetical protein